MITNEIYKDRITQNEEQQTKHLKYLAGVLNEYLIVYTKASHSKTYAVKMNALMDSYTKTKDLNVGLTICMELLKYDPSDKEKQTNIHIVISRIVYNAIKEIENTMNQDLLDKSYKILQTIDAEYREQYKDCYSKLAHIYKTDGDYDKATNLYTSLANMEAIKPAKSTVPASYLLTFCYIKFKGKALSEYDIDSANDVLDEYVNDGGTDYLNIFELIENQSNNLKANNQAKAYLNQHTTTYLNN